MKEFQTLKAFQLWKAGDSGRNAVVLIKHPALYPEMSRGKAAREAAHYVLCGGCDDCRAKWEEWEMISAAVRDTRLPVEDERLIA